MSRPAATSISVPTLDLVMEVCCVQPIGYGVLRPPGEASHLPWRCVLFEFCSCIDDSG